MRRMVALAVLLPAAALADTSPSAQPLRDVDVTYKVPVAGGTDMALLQRFRYSASLRRQRVDLPTSGNWMVLDFRTHRMQAVREESHEVVDAPVPDAAAPGYLRLASATVAGEACTEWQTQDLRGQQTITCYTADGIMLRARNGNRVLIEAVHVSRTVQDPAIFETPPGYTVTKAPE